MAYDEGAAQRIREILQDRLDIEEKEMFGGIAFLLGGNMTCGVIQDDLIIRVGPEAYELSVSQAHARPFDFTGRPMKGWILIAPDGYASDEDLESWVKRGLAFTTGLQKK
jgi:TfoX/Sxy family transcriptional regulator of competence genes